MKTFLICGLVFTLFVYFANGSIGEERRFREGNAFNRKMRSCSFFCSVKGNRGKYNQTRCYRIPSRNTVATDCVFKCLRAKGESPEAMECKCTNGMCLDEATTAAPTVPPETTAPSATTAPPATNAPTTNPPQTEGPATNPPQTQGPTTNPPTNPPNQPQNPSQSLRRNGNQGKKGVKGQNSKNGNRSKQKS